MCEIQFNIASTDTLIEAQGRYKLQGVFGWTNFTIDLNNPRTPDIIANGTYDLLVRVRGANYVWSNWVADSFRITESCNTKPVVTGIQFPNGNCCDNPTVPTSGNASISGSDIINSFGCEREWLVTIQGAPNEVISLSGCNGTRSLTLNASGFGTTNVVLATNAGTTTSCTLTITNSSNLNSSRTFTLTVPPITNC